MRPNGATSSWKPVSMRSDAQLDLALPAETSQAVALLRRAAQPEFRHLIYGIAWLIAAAGLEVTGPILGKALIDDHLLPHHLDWLRMALLLAGCVLTGWLASAVRYLQLVRLSGLAMRSVRRLRESVYGHVLHLPMAFFDQALTGQLISRVTNDTEAVKTLYVQVLFVMLDSSIVLIGAMLAMAWLDWRLMLIVLTLVPAVVVIVWFYQRWSSAAVARSRALRSDINAQMAESIGGMAVVQSNNATGRFGQRFASTNTAHFTARQAEVRANAWLLRPALDFLNILLLVVVIFSFGQRQMSGLEIGILYAFVSYIARVVDPLIQITLQFSQIQQAVIAAARVNQLLQEVTTPAVIDGAGISAGAVNIVHLGFGYDPAHPVIRDVSLRVPTGAFYGIVGHTGSGKTTLLSLLLRFYQPQSGQIEIDGIAIDLIDDEIFRAAIGLVPQEPMLLAATARENIDMGRGLGQEAIEAAATAAHAHGFIETLEHGYDTLMDEGGTSLSAGQKQLIAIARALAGQPQVLFLDEATSRIDSATEQIVQKALQELHGKVTVISIAHRLSTIRNADCIVVMNHGRIAEQGTHTELMAVENGIYQRLYLISCAASVELGE